MEKAKQKRENRAFVLALEIMLASFVGLKLFGAVDWSWGWVMSPVWLPLVLCVLAACLYREE